MQWNINGKFSGMYHILYIQAMIWNSLKSIPLVAFLQWLVHGSPRRGKIIFSSSRRC